jgi:pimeloyl-ACP methyl ester carboxylesterase
MSGTGSRVRTCAGSASASASPSARGLGVADRALHWSLGSASNARASDYTLELVPDCGHFIADELPAAVRERLVALVS